MEITTIILPISRKDYLHRIFAQLDMMPCNNNTTNLLAYVDGDHELYQIARNFVVNSKFKEKLCVYRRKGLPNVNHIHSRRRRIAEIHNEIKEIVTGNYDYLFLIEDDTLIPLNALQKLLSDYATHPFAGFITGVQIGRWGMTVPGIWQVNNPYDIKEIRSLLPPSISEIQEIDAAGLFCCLTKPAFYKKNNFKAFDPILGPDFDFGINLRKEGYKNYVNWSINTSHLTKKGEIKVKETPLQTIIFNKTGENQWSQDLK